MLSFNMLKSKTIWGVLLAILGWLLDPNVMAILPEAVAMVAQAVGLFLAAIGVRDAIAVNGVGSDAVKANAKNG